MTMISEDRLQKKMPTQVTPEILFALYEQEFQIAIDQLKGKYSKPHLVPEIMEMIQARRNQKALVQHVRAGVRHGIHSFVRSAIDTAERPERKATRAARNAAMTLLVE